MDPVLDRTLRHSILLSLLSFAMQALWEYVQCPLFFSHGNVPPTHWAMLIAILGDVGLTWVAQGVMALISGRWLWSLDHWTGREWAMLLLWAVVLSFAIELRAVLTGRWAYTELAPLIPGTAVSIVPVLQLVILFPATFQLTRKLLPYFRFPR